MPYKDWGFCTGLQRGIPQSGFYKINIDFITFYSIKHPSELCIFRYSLRYRVKSSVLPEDMREGDSWVSIYRVRPGGGGDRGSMEMGYCSLRPLAVVEGMMVQ